MQGADPQIRCQDYGEKGVCWRDAPPSGIEEIVYSMRNHRLGRIVVIFTADTLADGFDAVLERAKHEYGAPVLEKVPPTAKRIPTSRDDPFAIGVAEMARQTLSGAHETTWEDAHTVITLSYIPGRLLNPFTGKPDYKTARPSALLGIAGRAFKQQEDKEQRQADEREQQERRNMFDR